MTKMTDPEYRGAMAYDVPQRLSWESLRVETIEEGARRSMKVIHLPTLLAVEGVGENVPRRAMRMQLVGALLKLVQQHILAQRNGGAG